MLVSSLWITDPHSRAPKKNTSHGNEVLPQDTTHLIQRPCYQWVCLCQDPAGKWTTQRPCDNRKETKIAVVCHVSRSSSLAKTILQGTVKGGRRQGRQRKRWEDNIGEWTGLEFGKSQRAVKNREKWRKLVAKSSVLPQWPSQLRNWWWCKNKFVQAKAVLNFYQLVCCWLVQMSLSTKNVWFPGGAPVLDNMNWDRNTIDAS